VCDSATFAGFRYDPFSIIEQSVVGGQSMAAQ
jgi:hypothetical protein